MVLLLGPAGGALNAASQIARKHQAGDRREEVGGGPAVGWRPDLQEEVQNAEKPEAGGTVAGSTKRLASRFYQLKTGHCRTGQYLHWAKVRPTAQYWWCRCPTQTRDHLLKWCLRWKEQQKTLWGEVHKETGRGKWRWRAHELFADQRQSGTTRLSHNNRRGKNSAACGRGSRRRERGVGMGAPGSAGSGKRSAGWRRRRWVLGRSRCSYPPNPSWHRRRRSRGRAGGFLLSFLCLFPWCAITFREGRAEGTRGACNEPPRADCGRENRVKCTPPRSITITRSHASMNKQKKNTKLYVRDKIGVLC